MYSQIISYDSSRGGVSVVTEKGYSTTSFLLVQQAKPIDSGKYTCNPSNAQPKSITVHVLNGELYGTCFFNYSFVFHRPFITFYFSVFYLPNYYFLLPYREIYFLLNNVFFLIYPLRKCSRLQMKFSNELD